MPQEAPENFTDYLDKKATDLQRRFAEWLQGERVGYEPNSAKTKAQAFEEGVRLGVALRIPFQASQENRDATEAAREERALARAARKSNADEDASDEPVTAPRRGAKAAAAPAKAAVTAKATPAKAAPAGRRGRPASNTTEAPF